VAVAQSFSDAIAIRYVLPVLVTNDVIVMPLSTTLCLWEVPHVAVGLRASAVC